MFPAVGSKWSLELAREPQLARDFRARPGAAECSKNIVRLRIFRNGRSGQPWKHRMRKRRYSRLPRSRRMLDGCRSSRPRSRRKLDMYRSSRPWNRRMLDECRSSHPRPQTALRLPFEPALAPQAARKAPLEPAAMKGFRNGRSKKAASCSFIICIVFLLAPPCVVHACIIVYIYISPSLVSRVKFDCMQIRDISTYIYSNKQNTCNCLEHASGIR